jgi:oligopeptide transport system substrate-binding protein
VDLAQGWLAEAGYANGAGFPTIVLMHDTSEEHAAIAAAVAEMWEETLNIDVDIEEWKWLVYLKTLQLETPLEEVPHVWPLTWDSDYLDAHNWVHEVFHAEVGINWPRATRSSLEESTEAAITETDPEARRELYGEAERLLVEEEARIAPIYYGTAPFLIKPWVQYGSLVTDIPLFSRWQVDQEAQRDAAGG